MDGYFEKRGSHWVVRITSGIYPREGQTITVARKGREVNCIITRIIASEGKSHVGGGGKTYIVEVR